MISIYVRRDLHENGMSLQEYADAVIAGTHPILSHDEFVYQFGSLEDELALVNDWAVSNQLTVVESHVGMAVVKVSGTFEQFNALFGITLKFSETEDGHQYQTYDGTVTVPNEINDVVDTVLGFDQEPKFKPNLTPFADFEPEVHSDVFPQVYPTKAAVRPQRVATAYNMPAGDGYGGCVGIIELTYSGFVTGYSTTDVNSTFNRVGYPIPTIIDVLVDGATRSTTSDSESMLDIYCAGGVVPRAKLVCYTAPNTSQGFLDGILACANDTVNRPSALGISWGGGEYSAYLSSGFQACVAQGITCFSSTGDSGANRYTCLYPSTDPYQIAAGGTSIYLGANDAWNNETAWSGGGGGISSFVALPSWQTGLTSKTINGSGTLGSATVLPRRGVPDVSAPSDPNTGYIFYLNGVLVQYGGTSAAAPLLAGMVTRLTQLWGRRINFANTLFYANTSCFTDIVLGDNRQVSTASGYTTTVGWDAATGLGSPKADKIYQLLHVGSTFPKSNYGFRPTSGPGYPRRTSGAR
jgi:kumamolisin